MQCLLMLGQLALAEGDGERAWALFGECRDLWLDLGVRHGGSLIGLGCVRLLQGNLEEARDLLEQGLASASERNQVDALPGRLGLARFYILQGDYRTALRMRASREPAIHRTRPARPRSFL